MQKRSNVSASNSDTYYLNMRSAAGNLSEIFTIISFRLSRFQIYKSLIINCLYFLRRGWHHVCLPEMQLK